MLHESRFMIKAAKTILYCSKGKGTVRFYWDQLKLPVSFSTDWWFLAFSLPKAGASKTLK